MGINENEKVGQINSSSITMDLENLQKEYNNLLIQYKQAVSNYIDYLNKNAKNPGVNNVVFVSIKGQAYNGTGTAGESTAKTLQDCQADCASLKKCTGATFVNNKCLLRTGDSPIVPASDNSYAIIPQSKQMLLNIDTINQQLLSINSQLVNKIKTNEPVFYKNTADGKIKTEELKNNYNNLIKERESIGELLKQYETLDSVENENNIKTTQNYYSYILLLILAITILILFYKIGFSQTIQTSQNIQYGGELGINLYYVIFAIIIIIILINYYMKYYYL